MYNSYFSQPVAGKTPLPWPQRRIASQNVREKVLQKKFRPLHMGEIQL
jgi:hypothetical protein